MARVYTIETKSNLIIDGCARNIEEFAQEVEKIVSGEGNFLLSLNLEDFEEAPTSQNGEWYFTWSKSSSQRNYYCVCTVK